MTTSKSVDEITTTRDDGSRRAMAGEMAASVRGAAETVAARLPDAAASTRQAVDQAARRMETGSDEMLTAGATLSLGMAIGMLIGGAPRILVVLALIPAAAMGMTLLDRNDRAGTRAARRTGA